MKKVFQAFQIILAGALILCLSSAAFALEPAGPIYGTDIEYENFEISKAGIKIRLKNLEHSDVKVSLKLVFYDDNANTLGYSIFGLREIPAESYVDISNNYVNGDWKKCKKAFRMEWQRMTYEILY